MKKILLGTTILGATLMASPAFAQLETKVGGFIDFQAGFFDGASAVLDSDREFRNDVEVWILPTYKSDNGLTYGADIQIESTGGAANSALDYDEANIFVQGAWGKIELGDQDGASDKLAVYAPTAGIGQFDGDYDEFVPGVLRNTPGETYKAVDSSDASKITYYTPVFSGFQAGVSYAPEADQGDSIVRIAPAAGFSDFIEGGVAYTGDFSGIGVKASGTISTAEANAVGVDEFTSWALGAQVSYAGISFGGNYVDWDEASGVDNGWTIGLGYTTGPISVAANYQGTDYINGDEVQIYGVGGAYVVAQGLAVRADYVHVDRDTVADETDIVLISTRLSF